MKDKLKELSKDTVIYGISTIVGRFLNFLLVPFYTHVFVTSDYGLIANIYAYAAFLNILFVFGLDASYLKYASLAENKIDKQNNFSVPFFILIIISLVLGSILFLSKDSFNVLLKTPAIYSDLIYYLIFILFFDTLTVVPFAWLRLERKALKFASFKVINISVNILLNYILIVLFNYGIEAVLISNLIASIVSFILVLPVISKNIKMGIDKNILKKMLMFGIPYIPASLASMIVQVIDRPILLELTDRATLGIYQANYKMGIFMMLFVSMFQYAWQPFFLNNAKEKNAKEIFSRVLTFFGIVASLIWVTLTLFLDDIIKFNIFGFTLLQSNYWEGLEIIPIILLGYIFNGFYVNFLAGIYIEEKTKYLPIITGAGAVANVIINLLLIPIFGMMGAALATLVSYLVMSILLFLTSQKFYRINYEYPKLLKLLLLITVTIISYYTLIVGNFNLPEKLIVFAVFISLLFVLKILNFDEFRKTIKLFSR